MSSESLMKALFSEGLNIVENASAANLTTYRLGGNLRYVVTLNNGLDVAKLARHIEGHPLNGEDVFILGNGSNIIIADDGFDGIVFKFGAKYCDVLNANESCVEVGAGMLLPKFARKITGDGYGGLEFYVGIPGSVGGAVAMNAGGHGRQTSDVLISAKVLSLKSGEIKDYLNVDCDFSYRHSRFEKTDMVISAKYHIEEISDAEGKNDLDSIVKWRRENQPGGRNIGSVFQNTDSASAGSLIEKSGLKGFRIGGAFVSEKHANFIQADEGAKASDVVELIEYVRNVVKEKTGVELKNEVRYIGFENE